MARIKLISTIVILGICSQLYAQAPIKFREVGLNMSPLIVQLVPFGNSNIETGPIGMQWTFGRNEFITRIGIGIGIDFQQESNSYINLRFGFGKEKRLEKNWIFYRGVDIWAFSGGFNIPFESIDNAEDVTGIGLAPFVGLKYEINKHINFGTEGNLFLGKTEETWAFQFIPPISIFLNVRLGFDSSKI